jgi:arsenate reductase (thioredoxin)
MAEGLLRSLGGRAYEVFSAGIERTSVRPEAITVMTEIGIDISAQQSKTLDQFLSDQFEYVITVCDDANESCPVFLGAKTRLHWSFPDPSQASGSSVERLKTFQFVRDGIQQSVRDFLQRLE